jgi:hypothetical protein
LAKIDLDAIKKLHETNEAKKNRVQNDEDFLKNFFTLKDGKNTMRLLPSKEDEERPFFAETTLHRIAKGDKGSKNVHCVKGVHGSCPLCDLYYALWKTEIKSDAALARGIKPTKRYYLNAVSRDANEDGSPNTPKILSIPPTIMNIIVEAMTDPDFGDVTDFAEGNDFVVVKKMVKDDNGNIWPKYDNTAFRAKKTSLGTAKEIKALMGLLHDIHGLVKHQPLSEVQEEADKIRAKSTLGSIPQAQPVSASVIEREEPEDPSTEEEYLEVLKKGTKK